MHDETSPVTPKVEYCPNCKDGIADSEPFCRRCGFDLRHGTVNRARKGTCLYCAEVRPLTKEHVYGKWLKARFRGNHRRTLHTYSRPLEYKFWEESEHRLSAPKHYADAYDHTVSTVCSECNSGWMSQVHRDAADIVASFAKGNWPELSELESKALTRWAIMVSINLEHWARMPISTTQQRRILKEGGVPAGWAISLGRMTDQMGAGRSHHQKATVPIEGFDDFLQLSMLYFVIEKVAFFVTCSFTDRILELCLLSAGFANRLPRSLWPNPSVPVAAASDFVTLRDLDALIGYRR